MNLCPGPGVKGARSKGKGKGMLAIGDGGGGPSKSKGKPAVGGESGGGTGQQDLFQPGGLWFGHDFQLEIEGCGICGRYIKAKNALKLHGEDRPLPLVFHAGGNPSARKGKGKGQKPAVGGINMGG